MAERISMNGGNGQGRLPVEILDMHFPALGELPPPRPRRRPLWPALILFLLTVVSTLAVGSEFARSYAQNQEPFSGDQNPLAMMLVPLAASAGCFFSAFRSHLHCSRFCSPTRWDITSPAKYMASM